MKILLYTLKTFFLVLWISNIQAQPTFSLPDVSAKPGETVCLPFTVRDFTDIIEIRFDLTWESEIISNPIIQNINPDLVDLDLGDFDLNLSEEGKLTFFWKTGDDCFGPGGTLFDHAILFEICFDVVGQFGEQSPIKFPDALSDVFVTRTNTGCTNIGHFHKNGSITICPNACPKLYVNHDIAFQNQIVCIDIQARDFQKIQSAQLSLSWEPQILKFQKIENILLPNLSLANFDLNLVANGELGLSWSISPDSVSLDDNEVLFQICYKAIGEMGATSKVEFSNSLFTKEILTTEGEGGIFENGSTKIVFQSPDAMLSASHEIGGQGDLVCVDILSDIDLSFLSYSIHWDETVLNYVDFENHFLFAPFGSFILNDDYVSKGYLSVEVMNNSIGIPGSSTDPLSEICFEIIGELGDTSLIEFRNQPSHILVDNIGGQITPYFPQISTGSVSISNPACIEIFPAQELTGSVDDTIEVDFLTSGFLNIVSMQFELDWNPDALEFIEVQSFNLSDWNQNSFGLQFTNEGKLPATWFDPNTTGHSLPDSSLLFKVKFKVLPDAQCLETLYFPGVSTAMFPPEFFDSQTGLVCHNLSPTNILTQNSPNLIESITPDTALCGGGLIQLHVDAPTAETIQWFPEDNLSCTDCPSPFVTIAHTHEFYVIVTDSSGCTEEGQVLVNVHFGLDWGLLPFSNSPVCEGDELILFEELHFDIVTYEWVGPGGFVSNEASPVITDVTIANAGIYTGTFTDEFGCEGVAEAFVEVLDCPQIINATITDVDCPGNQNGSIELTIIGGSGDYEIEWFGPIPGLPPVTFLENLQIGAYQVIITDVLNGATTNSTFEIEASPDAPIADAGEDIVLDCGTFSTVLDGSNSSIGPNIIYFWEVIEGGGLILPGHEIITNPTILGIGRYKLTIIDTLTNCTVSDTVLVSHPIIPGASGNIEMEKEVICEGDTIQLEASGFILIPNYIFEWKALNGGLFVPGTDSTLSPQIISPGVYTLTFTDTTTSCMHALGIEIKGFEITSITTQPILTCEGIYIEGIISDSFPNVTYEWQGPCINSDPTEPQIKIGNCLGTYILTATDGDSGCIAIDSIVVDSIVQDIEIPISDAGPNLQLNCLDTILTLNGGNSSIGPEYLYEWTTFDGHIISDFLTLTPQVNQPGIYFLTVINAENGCTSTSEVEVTLDTDLPTIPPLPSIYFCEGESFQLDLSWLNAMEYEWTPTIGIDNPNSPNVTIAPPSSMTYTVHLTFPNFCTTAASFDVTYDLDCPWPVDTIKHTFVGNSLADKTFLDKSKTEKGLLLNEKNVIPLEIFPNPAKDIIYLKSDDANLQKVEWYSMDGKLLESTQLSENQFTLKVDHLQKGIYLLKVYTGQGVYNKRVLIF